MRKSAIAVLAWVLPACSATPPASRDADESRGTFEELVLADSITGTVVDDERRPVAGATVTLFLSCTMAEKQAWASSVRGGFFRIQDRMEPVGTAATRANGRYAFHGLEDGQYTLRVIAPGYCCMQREVLIGVLPGS